MFMSKKSRAKIDLNFLRPSPCTDKKWKSPWLLWTVHLNLKVNDIVVPETLGDDRPVRSILFMWLRACKVEDV